MKRRLFDILSALSLLLCLAVVALWVRSYWSFNHIHFVWYARGTDYNRVTMDSLQGQVALGYVRDHNGQPYCWKGYYPFGPSTRWGFDFYYGQLSNGREDYMAVWAPYWVFALSTAVLPLLWLNSHIKRQRRPKHGLCPTCGYDLRASKDRCPECGTAIPVQTVSSGKA